MRPKCECFSLCNNHSAVAFHLRLPIVQDKASPWHAYLDYVYSAATPPLPFDMASLELFYPALLPTSMCDRQSRLPPCRSDDSTCDGWLDKSRPEPTEAEIRLQLRSQSYICSAASLATTAVRERKPLSQFVALQEAVRWPTAHDQWVEVVRIQPHLDPEGVGIGCWLYVARGSGVHVNVGRTLVFRSREEALATRNFGVWRNSSSRRKNRAVLTYSDHNLASAAAREGYRSLQLLRGNPHVIRGRPTAPTRELILAHPACMERPANSACVPAGLRAGWRAALPCKCASPQSVSAVGINCKGLAQRDVSHHKSEKHTSRPRKTPLLPADSSVPGLPERAIPPSMIWSAAPSARGSKPSSGRKLNATLQERKSSADWARSVKRVKDKARKVTLHTVRAQPRPQHGHGDRAVEERAHRGSTPLR
jgi:hypothetical protein